MAFKLFACEEFHAEYQLLEVTCHTLLTDQQVLHYCELPKLPEAVSSEDKQRLWLTLFRADTEEELERIEEMGAPIMEEAIKAYCHITAADEFKETARLRDRARHNEASALGHAWREGRAEGEQAKRAKWQDVVADKDAVLAKQAALIAELQARLGGSV